jgi:hypothetical protein
LFVLLVSSGIKTFGQTTITSADVSSQYAVGNSYTTHIDTIATTVDIGNTGSTSWDFSFLVPNPDFDFTLTSVNPGSTPYIGRFPGSNIAVYGMTNSGGFSLETYQYFSVNGSFDFHGDVSELELGPGFSSVTTVTPNPVETLVSFPFTYNSTTSFNGTTTRVTELTGFPPDTTIETVISNVVVDAYGPMTLPGGTIVDALRLRDDETTITAALGSVSNRDITYIFLAKTGAQVFVPSDTNQPNTGVITNSSSIAWIDDIATDVRSVETTPTEYSLKQNYPNPFNPSTFIEYSIPEASFVRLTIHDILGNEVATLVNEEQSAGVYRADFTAQDLASGVYIARIRAGNYTNSVRMILMK